LSVRDSARRVHGGWLSQRVGRVAVSVADI